MEERREEERFCAEKEKKGERKNHKYSEEKGKEEEGFTRGACQRVQGCQKVTDSVSKDSLIRFKNRFFFLREGINGTTESNPS